VTDSRDIANEEKIYSVADAITVPSSFAARSFVEEGVPAEKVRVIPYGVRLEQFVRTGAPKADRFEVLFAGSVSLRKGVPTCWTLLRSFGIRQSGYGWRGHCIRI